MHPQRILAVGIVSLILLLFYLINIRGVVVVESLCFFLLLVLGFVLQPHEDTFQATLCPRPDGGAASSSEPRPKGDLPQTLLIRVEFRNLPLLLATTVLVLGFVSSIVGEVVRGLPMGYDPENIRYMIAYFGTFFNFVAIAIAVVWFRERFLLRAGNMILTPIFPLGQTYRYEFFDPSGERRSGFVTGRLWTTQRVAPKWVNAGVVAVLLDRVNYDYSMPVTGFVFHRFDIADER